MRCRPLDQRGADLAAVDTSLMRPTADTSPCPLLTGEGSPSRFRPPHGARGRGALQSPVTVISASIAFIFGLAAQKALIRVSTSWLAWWAFG